MSRTGAGARPVPAGIDPDAFLQRLVDLASAEVHRLEAKHRANSDRCEECGAGGQLTKEERGFIVGVLKEVRQTTFAARKLVMGRLLSRLSEGQLEQLEQAMAGEKEGEWLPR
jgi:hypothetical protein